LLIFVEQLLIMQREEIEWEADLLFEKEEERELAELLQIHALGPGFIQIVLLLSSSRPLIADRHSHLESRTYQWSDNCCHLFRG